MNTSKPEVVLLQTLMAFAVTSAPGLWMTLSALRVIREPSRVKEKSLINWVIRTTAANRSLGIGNVRFWAWMAFLAGVVLDFAALLALVAVVEITLLP